MARTTRIDDGAVDRERMRELGRRGAAAVERDPVTKRFRRREPATGPAGSSDPTPAPTPESPPAPTVTEAPGLLRRFLRRDR